MTYQFEEIYTDGRYIGAVAYSTKRNCWAATWNACPNDEEEPNAYLFPTKNEAIDFLPIRYPTNGTALSLDQVIAHLKANNSRK